MHYIWDKERGVREVADVFEWARWFEKSDRHVAKDLVLGHLVSTVFLGVDHNFGVGPSPVLWETMIFCKREGCECGLDEWQDRATSHNGAERVHLRALALVFHAVSEAGPMMPAAGKRRIKHNP